ncbi:hypothetical protein FRC14_001497 [Serendipita sp. 396]|nr:hypothetical protein FRC14_001497 [Serendipita sp. 396]KAG8785459.1 hypothetical protein FRC15_001320 [Serendipita sp. 397]KAG8800051.1 hypothetical protein FRC16_003824 [Serendipita sp. 398]KAG8815091.1 hypothetical protein FRC18_001646 [Serendipita sp. 400]KAG8826951.1 hypothetical protein FRC19_006575 [Serendipita sp. 401]KAG8869295.1 hypothetical protein FRC20_001733 [Serendipita sp. 405]KAG9057607.1 hypothetical protein FS842_005311 [Serendipita sp. 407]
MRPIALLMTVATLAGTILATVSSVETCASSLSPPNILASSDACSQGGIDPATIATARSPSDDSKHQKLRLFRRLTQDEKERMFTQHTEMKELLEGTGDAHVRFANELRSSGDNDREREWLVRTGKKQWMDAERHGHLAEAFAKDRDAVNHANGAAAAQSRGDSQAADDLRAKAAIARSKAAHHRTRAESI